MTVGMTRGAGWQIGVSKTVDRPVEEVWAFLTSPAGMAIWLGEGVRVLDEPGAGYQTTNGIRGETRSFHELDRVRLTWQPADWSHDTTLQLTVRAAGPGRAMLRVHQERLADAGERERQRSHWRGVIAALVAALVNPAPEALANSPAPEALANSPAPEALANPAPEAVANPGPE